MSGDQVTALLAAEMAETPTASIPAASMAAMHRLFVDHVGITYMGAAFTGAPLHRYARELGGPGEALLIGTSERVPAELAAGINSQLCRNTDFEETGPGTHLGPLVVHTALAVGQRVRASGRDVLAAATLGYALCARFHFARTRDWPRTSIVHHRTVAAAIAARLMGQDTATMARTLSLSWEIPPRTHQGGGADFIAGRISPLALSSGVGAPLFGARLGVQAAQMIAAGFESVPAEIDRHLADYDLGVLQQKDTPFHHVEGQMELKPWVASRHCQCGLQALSNIVHANRIDPARLTRVRLHLSNMYQRPWLNDPAPRTYWEAIYSTQWAAAMILRGIPAGPRWVDDAQLADPESRRLAAMVEIVEDPEATRAYWGLDWLAICGTAEIATPDGVFKERATMRETYGSPGMNMPAEMVAEKFVECSASRLSPAAARTLLAALNDLPACPDVNQIAERM